jgi:hypothetical protein
MELKGSLVRLAGAGAALALGSTVMVLAAPSASAASANISLPYGASYYTGTATWSNRGVGIDGSFKATGCRRVYARAFAGSTTLDFQSTSTWCNRSGPADFSLTADVVGGSDNIWVYMTDENGTHLKEQTCYRSSGVCIDGLH